VRQNREEDPDGSEPDPLLLVEMRTLFVRICS
jgi:hypothetical protein